MTHAEMIERVKRVIGDLAVLISDVIADETGNTTEGGERVAKTKKGAAKPKGKKVKK